MLVQHSVQHLIDRLSSGWDKHYGHVLAWIMCAWIGKVGPLLMMELASLMFLWSLYFDFGGVVMMININ